VGTPVQGPHPAYCNNHHMYSRLMLCSAHCIYHAHLYVMLLALLLSVCMYVNRPSLELRSSVAGQDSRQNQETCSSLLVALMPASWLIIKCTTSMQTFR
jgi:hypothetical protein